MRLRLLSSLLVALTMLSLSEPVLAQGQAPSDADRAAARELGREGLEALDAKDYDTAVDRLTRAIALYDVPTLRLGRARALRAQGRLLSAAEDYRAIKRYAVQPGDPSAMLEAQQSAEVELKEVEAQLARLTIFVQEGSKLKVSVDGVQWQSAVLGVARPIDPGEHVIESEAPGGEKQTQTVTLEPGANDVVTLEAPAGQTSVEAQGSSTASPAPTEPRPPPQPKAKRPKQIQVELAGSLGLAVPVGDQVEGSKLSDSIKLGLPFGFYGGVRFAPGISVGLYLNLGPGIVGDSDQDICDLSDASCSVAFIDGGLQGAYRIATGGSMTPWVGLGLGAEALVTSLDDDFGNSGSIILTAAPQVRLVGGVDLHGSDRFEWGPFLAASFATYNHLTAEDDAGNEVSEDVPDDQRTSHAFVTFGVRAAFLP